MKKKFLYGLLVIIGASVLWAILPYAGIKMGGLGAGLFMLAVLYVFAKATGQTWFEPKENS